MNIVFTKKKGIIKASSVLILSFIILTLNYRSDNPSWIESFVVGLFSPVQQGVSTLIHKSKNTFNYYFYLLEVEDKIIDIEKENQRLTFENNTLKENLFKYQRLETLFSVKKSFNKNKLLLADVAGFEASGWSQMLIINKGKKYSVVNNNAVITHKGLVGRVVITLSNYSKVLMITNGQSAIDALIQRSRDRGIVVGTNKSFCEMKYLSINADVKIGDLVISSGMGRTIQKGLLIGSVSEISDEKGGLFKKIKILPSSDMNSLEEVFVVLKPEP